MKSTDVKDNTYIDSVELHSMELHSNKEVDDKDPKFKVGDYVKIFKIQKHFC